MIEAMRDLAWATQLYVPPTSLHYSLIEQIPSRSINVASGLDSRQYDKVSYEHGVKYRIGPRMLTEKKKQA